MVAGFLAQMVQKIRTNLQLSLADFRMWSVVMVEGRWRSGFEAWWGWRSFSWWWPPPWPGHGEGGQGGEHPPPGCHLRRARQERGKEHGAPLQVSYWPSAIAWLQLTNQKTKTKTNRHLNPNWPVCHCIGFRGKRQLCPKVSTKLLSRQQLWQLRSTIPQNSSENSIVMPGREAGSGPSPWSTGGEMETPGLRPWWESQSAELLPTLMTVWKCKSAICCRSGRQSNQEGNIVEVERESEQGKPGNEGVRQGYSQFTSHQKS